MAEIMIRFDDLLAAHRAKGAESRVLIREDGRPVPLAELEGLIGGAEVWLRDQGLVRGDRIALMMLNRPEWLALFLAAARIGVAVAVVNTRYRAHEVHHILKSSGARLAILQDDGQRPDFVELLRDLPGEDLPALEGFALLTAGGGITAREGLLCRPLREVDLHPAPLASDTTSNPDDPVIFFTTSGTTSLPKLVVHTQRSLSRHATAARDTMGLWRLPTRAYIAGLPFCGVFGLNPTLASLGAAVPIQMLAMFDAAQAAACIRREQATHMLGSDEMYRRLLDEDETILRGMSLCGFGAFTPGLSELLAEAARKGAPLVGVYGSSEVHAIFGIQRLDLPVEERLKGGGTISPVNDARLKVVDPETGADLPLGQAGLLRIAAATNFAGYWNNPEATAKAVDAEGFFTTGDMAQLREDGSFVYLARMGDAIRLAGFLTDPAEIEEALKEISGLSEVQVIGVEIDGQTRAAAFVRRDPALPLDQPALLAGLKGGIAGYKVPARIWEVAEFPTVPSANGVKIQRTTLRQWALDRLAAEGNAA